MGRAVSNVMGITVLPEEGGGLWLSATGEQLSCPLAGQISPLLIYLHPRTLFFHHHSHMGETGCVVPTPSICSASPCVLSHGKC